MRSRQPGEPWLRWPSRRRSAGADRHRGECEPGRAVGERALGRGRLCWGGAGLVRPRRARVACGLVAAGGGHLVQVPGHLADDSAAWAAGLNGPVQFSERHSVRIDPERHVRVAATYGWTSNEGRRPAAAAGRTGPDRTGETPARSALACSEAAGVVHSHRDLTLDPLDELVSDGQLVEFADLLVEDAGGDEAAGFADA